MPYVQIRLSSAPAGSLELLGREATRLMAQVMGKRREVTVVEVVPSAGAWFVAGEPATGPSAYVDIKITRGTNDETQKSRLLADFQALLETALGALGAPAYVVIHEVPGSDWGYAGRSQASRQGARL